MVEFIKHKDEIVAIILRSGFCKDGANFFTTKDDPFQFGVLQYKKQNDIPAHKHIMLRRNTDLVSEFLFIQTGKIEVAFFGEDNKKIDSRVLNAGDAILLKKFGHGFKLLEDSKIIEIKQGPYLGKDKDKEYLDI